ncbi:MAG: hypothetical protein JWO33_1699 [Caulobacteraceae bacterium]|nr:hypothetical protein [Caulobacteraceae bacterium]
MRLVNRLADRDGRREAAARLAAEAGAEALLVLLRDPEVDALRPAPGFDQTLPGGPSWRAFLAACAEPGELAAEVAWPDRDTLKPVCAYVASDGTVLALIGGAPAITPAELARLMPLAFALLATETVALAASGLAAAARGATSRATSLAGVLDAARAELAGQAKQLRALNETLEHRVAEEIAERLKAEASLRQAQKMEAIGQLTGGVAHDFNNLLTVIMGGLDTINRQLETLPDLPALARVRRSGDMSFRAAQRAATLTARLLAFSRRQALDPKPIDANRLTSGLADLLQRTLGEQVALETVAAPGLWPTHADPAELESALVNLAVNARDAMPDGGKLTIETANVFLDEAYVAEVPEPVAPGQYVMIAVTDTGAGMDAETLGRVFEPFFTTKAVGKGTGLGLSQVYGFVRQSGGHVRIYSEQGVGTTVKVYLPRHRAALEVDAIPAMVAAPDGGHETILVVEDHEDLRAYSTAVLRDLGYHVLEAANGRAALETLQNTRKVDLLFTDVVLPDGMDGRRLADEARKKRPDLKVLYTTGYTRNAIVHNGRLDPGVELVPKPFTYEALASKVRRILDELA